MIWPLTKEGSSGENVRSVQYLLTAHGYSLAIDGVFGPLTKGAVEAFQAAHGLGVDGIVGNQTWPQLIVQVTLGSTGDAVRAVQSQIHGRGEGGHIAVDGDFGPMTSDAVGGFQQLLGLSVDHVVGPITWNHLVNGYLAAPDAETAAENVFAAWAQHSAPTALLNATPAAVAKLFSETFSAADSWVFQGSEGAAGHVYSSWQNANGSYLRIGVENGFIGVFYAADVINFS